jgi:hypothetical protein
MPFGPGTGLPFAEVLPAGQVQSQLDALDKYA